MSTLKIHLGVTEGIIQEEIWLLIHCFGQLPSLIQCGPEDALDLIETWDSGMSVSIFEAYGTYRVGRRGSFHIPITIHDYRGLKL